jgi:hypothetical protein
MCFPAQLFTSECLPRNRKPISGYLDDSFDDACEVFVGPVPRVSAPSHR